MKPSAHFISRDSCPGSSRLSFTPCPKVLLDPIADAKDVKLARSPVHPAVHNRDAEYPGNLWYIKATKMTTSKFFRKLFVLLSSMYPETMATEDRRGLSLAYNLDTGPRCDALSSAYAR